LLPLGPDPTSGLWEFAHLITGAPARRGADGRLAMNEATGLVLVLLPGGSFWMGAQSSDPGARNYDPDAGADEGPVHAVELSAFFLSKFEMTQGQWLRLVGRNPSYHQSSDHAPTLLHPVEQVSWLDCAKWLPRAGLTLPSEAQWEYGARAGTDTPWWTGAERETLRTARAANLADRSAARAGATWGEIKDWPELDDGWFAHAPAGALAPNAFGLHEVHGNLWEWCLDGYDRDFYAQSPARDPVAPWENAAVRVDRGGSFNYAAAVARSANRNNATSSLADVILGVRPARAIE
jgi:formylglycine-generating enzyme required for sulfatase activity